MIYQLIEYFHKSHLKMLAYCRDISIAGHGLQTLSLCSALLSRKESIHCHTDYDMVVETHFETNMHFGKFIQIALNLEHTYYFQSALSVYINITFDADL